MATFKKLLVVSHEASYTGAPILLLHLMHLLKQKKDFEFKIIIARGGPLVHAFKELGDVVVLKPSDYSKRNHLQKIIPFITSRLKLLYAIISCASIDFILLNSITNGFSASYLRFCRKPMLVYVHELESVRQLFRVSFDLVPVLKYADLFLCPSNAVREFVASIKPDAKFAPLNYYFPTPVKVAKLDVIDADEKVIRICGVGIASPRKGTDLFIEVAAHVCKANHLIHFDWIGGFASDDLENEYKAKVTYMGLSNALTFRSQLTPNYAKLLYADYDLLFLSSREDPYPLVVLEAAQMSKPSLVFDGCGGITDFTDTQTGYVAKKLDIEDAANIILGLDKQSLNEKGKNAFLRVQALHLDQNLILNQFDHALAELTNAYFVK